MTLFLLAILSLSFGDTRMFLSVCPPLKCSATPCFPHIFFKLSHMLCTYGITMWHFLAGYLDVGVCFFLSLLFFSCCCWKIFLIAHLGCLHRPTTSSRWCNSHLNNCGVEQMVCALCVKVLITLYIGDKLWLLSHGRYRSVCYPMGGANQYEWAFCIPLFWRFYLFLVLWWYPKKGWNHDPWIPQQWTGWKDPLSWCAWGLCKYSKWAIKKIFQQQWEKKRSDKKKQTPTSKYPARKCHIVIPYVHSICDSLMKLCGKHVVAEHFKGGQTL